MADLPRLVSVPASNYVEKARWALQLARIAFHEDKHVPIFHRFTTKPLGGSSVPLLFFPESKSALTDSTDILDFCAKEVPALYESANAKEMELFYDRELGPHTRRLAYFFCFQDSSLAKELIVAPASSRFERVIARLCFPVIKMFLSRFMAVNKTESYRSLDKVEAIVAEVNGKLGDDPIGSRFLAGESSTFSAADISFCAHMSLLLSPQEHAYLKPLPPSKDPSVRARIEELKKSKAAQFVLWCYKNKRPPISQVE